MIKIFQPKFRTRLLFKFTIISLGLYIWVGCQFGGGRDISASEVYELQCKRCHGSDGRKGKKGAKDLNLSTMKLDARISHISNGKGKMPAFNDRLSEDQIKAVAKYTLETFRVDRDSTEH